jgi:RsiW-degrading membrane proteinase PrsW (M82 family)
MTDRRDPLQRVADDEEGLDGVVFWSGEGFLDRPARVLHRLVSLGGRALLVLFAGAVIAGQLALTLAAAAAEPVVGAYILLSAMPALGLAAYVWRLDVTRRQPLSGLLATFLLGVLFAGFAGELNGAMRAVFERVGLAATPFGVVLFFYLVVGPVEETVKLLAVRLSAYRTPSFGAVVDGAVYGAAAGLGFATIENAVYIVGNVVELGPDGNVVVDTFRIAAVRSFAGPGHVIYSAFAGYYLGLAKFNETNRGPIVVKGLLVAALVHATYNTAVSFLPVIGLFVPPLAALGEGALFIGFVLTYDGVFGYLLYRKIDAYRQAYRGAGVGADPGPSAFPVARTEFDPPTGKD